MSKGSDTDLTRYGDQLATVGTTLQNASGKYLLRLIDLNSSCPPSYISCVTPPTYNGGLLIRSPNPCHLGVRRDQNHSPHLHASNRPKPKRRIQALQLHNRLFLPRQQHDPNTRLDDLQPLLHQHLQPQPRRTSKLVHTSARSCTCAMQCRVRTF